MQFNHSLLVLTRFGGVDAVRENTRREAAYQAGLKKRIKGLYPNCLIHKNDPNDIQGVPDLLVSHAGKCAYLEVKRSSTATHRPNQDYYVGKICEDGGFARFIFPENEDEVLKEMEEFFNGVQV